MSLRHALLGVLKDQPLTGYDLVRHFQGTVGYVWSAPQSQIYPELRRMESEGLITAKVAPRGRRAQKRIYSVTDDGMAELRRWAADFMPLPAQRDPIILKAAFFDLAPSDAVREQLSPISPSSSGAWSSGRPAWTPSANAAPSWSRCGSRGSRSTSTKTSSCSKSTPSRG